LWVSSRCKSRVSFEWKLTIRGLPSDARLAIHQDQSAPKIADFETWLTHHRARVSAKSPLGEALKYIAKYWAGVALPLNPAHCALGDVGCP
jgi:transposase